MRFIRKNGRVIPIRETATSVGVTTATAGAAAAIYGMGKANSAMQGLNHAAKHAEGARKIGGSLGRLMENNAKMLGLSATNQLAQATKTFKLGSRIFMGGAVLALASSALNQKKKK